MPQRCLSWLHIGDLHARVEDRWLGVERLAKLIDECGERLALGDVDFVYLPGDNANEGEPEQYRRLREILSDLKLAPLHVIPGDHDYVPGDLMAFNAFCRELDVKPPPKRVELKGRRVLFLDIVSAGGGGPEFDLGREQTVWLDRELDAARRGDAYLPVVLMHAFPGDLAYDGAAVAERFARAGVAIVDTGHTHYNEVINDGQVVYTAARSTAQIEEEGEDAFGMAFVAVDGDQASFRFRRAGSGWPFVMITSPADHRLQVRPVPLDSDGRLTVRAKMFGPRGEAKVTLRALGEEVAMTPVSDEAALWSATLEVPWREALEARAPPERRVNLTVRAETADGVGEDVIRLGPKIPAPPVGRGGAAGGSVGAWPEHGLLGTRLGPNAYGKDW